MKWSFGNLNRNPKPEQKPIAEEVQDAQIGLMQWEMEEREKRHASELDDLKSTNGIDHLTGVQSRKLFEEELEHSLKMIRGEAVEHRAGAEPLTKLALIVVDVDHFKAVNDTLGHHGGDMVLKKVAETLMNRVRSEDAVGRWGGEEFFVLLRGVDQKAAVQKAEELRVAIENLSFEKYEGLKVTASFGVVSSEASTDRQTLEMVADKAMYEAKRNGRNCIYEG